MNLKHLSFEGTIYSDFAVSELLDKGIPKAAVMTAIDIQLGRDIDAAAGNARAAFVSPGSYIDQEYLMAKQEAGDWLANGENENDIPPSVSDHMAMTGQGATEAAQAIVATAEEWDQALRHIRTLRLSGKTAVAKADTEEGKQKAVADTVSKLEELASQAV